MYPTCYQKCNILMYFPSDYSQDFDSSVADELEQSIRDVVPDRSLLIRTKSVESVVEETMPTSSAATQPTPHSPTSARRLSFEDSFAKFTVDMVKQYMREEETRASHQNTLLKLREQALKVTHNKTLLVLDLHSYV